MQVKTFIASSAAQAVAQIRETLGPEAVVLNIRRVRAKGISGLFQRTNVEVLACVPKTAEPKPTNDAVLDHLREELASIKEIMLTLVQREASPPGFVNGPDDSASDLRISPILEESGLLRLYAHQIVDQIKAINGRVASSSVSEELSLAQRILTDCWKSPRPIQANTHIFVGPPGSGKTTALCKWMTNAVLLENRQACVWRLDGLSANTSEALSVHCEILGVPIHRCPASMKTAASEMLFVDLPGVNTSDETGLVHLQHMLAEIGEAEVHLVLNGSYESSVQLAQVRSFSRLPINDLIVTHLDEDTRWGKLWNLVLGTNYALRALSAGQNIPGDFRTASAAELLRAQFARK
ncbi:MAG: flagellar biosynthesis protein FlhF [Verrucomicrobiales bacterium]|jgi:flagellar biosynthesis protein FlhF|nr:flagellar biosynthesis protein FlhF [Verrucomicrobiales bacterium]